MPCKLSKRCLGYQPPVCPGLVDYEGFLANDDGGKTVLKSAIEDTVAAALAIDDGKLGSPPPSTARDDNFNITSDAIGVGGRDSRYPYPKTENWQKAIGAHFIWMDAAVKVKIDPAAKKRSFEVRMNLHMEDMYNFNLQSGRDGHRHGNSGRGEWPLRGYRAGA